MIVAGFGCKEDDLKDLVGKLKLKNVEFVGKIANEEMPKIYDSADIYLNSSLVDNMPLSIIEAFAAGIPVVSSNAGGIPYLIEDGKTGMLVELNDAREMADKTIFLLQNQQVADNIILSARKEVLKYTWENTRRKWTEFYKSLVIN